MELKPPKRPWRNFYEFVAMRYKLYFVSELLSEGKYPCTRCSGRGVIYDPNDPPCPVEGYKMVDRIKCPSCGGTRVGPKKVLQAEYRYAVAEWRRKRDEFNARLAAYKSAMNKLTGEEYKAVASVVKYGRL